MWWRRKEASSEVPESIDLVKWQHPQEDVVLHFSEKTCDIFFLCLDEEGNPVENTIGKLSFASAWAVRSVRSECCPHLTAFGSKSSILTIHNSLWIREIEKYFYTESSKECLRRNARHFIVQGHDIFHEVLAEGFEESYLIDGSPGFSTIDKFFLSS